METKDTSNQKPVYVQEVVAHQNKDEINLVDLALVVVRRKILVLVIISITLVAGLITAKYNSEAISHNYSTTIKIGSVGSHVVTNQIIPLESPETLLGKIKHNFIPQVLNEYDGSYEIAANIPKNSHLIFLQVASKNEKDLIPIELLNKITQKVEQDHNKIFTSIKNRLDASLKKVDVDDYIGQLATLQQTYVVSEPIKSVTSTSKFSNKTIILIALFAGIFLAVFAAFFADFWCKVTDKISEEN